MTEKTETSWQAVLKEFVVGCHVFVALDLRGMILVRGGIIEEASTDLMTIGFPGGGFILTPGHYAGVFRMGGGYMFLGSREADEPSTRVFLKVIPDGLLSEWEELLKMVPPATEWKM